MQSRRSTDDPLVSRSEIALLAGVKRPAVTNWQRRHEDFPEPIRSGDTEYFSLARLLSWLEARPIPADVRAATEPVGTTYADRVRRNRRSALPRSQVIPAADLGSLDSAETQQLLDELMSLADQVRGGASVVDYLNLLSSLVLLHVCAPDQWPALSRAAQSMSSLEGAKRLLRHIGGSADEVLRKRGLLPGVYSSLRGLRPRAHQDLASAVRLSSSLGPSAFRLLLDLYETWVGLKSREFFTPQSLAQLIARILRSEKSTVKRIYDPYSRGGELLAAVVAENPQFRASPPIIRAEGPYRDNLRLAGMNLALYGVTAQVETSSSAPWAEKDWPRHQADLIVTNPPFNRGGAVTWSRETHQWPYGAPPAGNDNFAWLQYVTAALNVGGRAAVVMPNSAGVSANPQELGIRKKMVERGAVECVIALPAQLFAGASTRASLWILRYPENTCGQVLFVDARKMGVKSRNQCVLTERDQQDIEDAYRSWRADREDDRDYPGNWFSVSVGAEHIRSQGCSLYAPDYLVGKTGAGRERSTVEDSIKVLMDTRAEERHLRNQELNMDAELGRRRFWFIPNRSGFLAAGWQSKPLHTLCEIQAGPSYSRLRASERSADGVVPVVLPKHINNRHIIAIDHGKVSHGVAKKLEQFKLRAGDILCVRSGTTGPSALVNESQAGWLFSTNLIRIRRFNASEVDPGYLAGYLSLPRVVEWIQNRSEVTTTVPSISSESLGQLPIEFPPLAEQQRISMALSALDEQVTARLDLARVTERLRVTLAEHLLDGTVTVSETDIPDSASSISVL